METKLQAPHGLIGMDTSTSFPYWETFVTIIFLSITITGLMRIRRRKIQVSAEKNAPSLYDRISDHRSSLSALGRRVDPISTTDIVSVSLSLRQSVELLCACPLSDMTFEEIQESLPSVWPLEKSYQEFLSILRSMDSIKYQNAELSQDDIKDLLIQTDSWLELCQARARQM